MHDLIAHTFQQEAGRVIAALYASMRDLELVEDAVQDALVLALERWLMVESAQSIHREAVSHARRTDR